MYLLYATDQASLKERSQLFEQHIEPLLQALETHVRSQGYPPNLPEIGQYLQVCRWPFRRLEYSFALDVLLDHLQPGQRYLDAGCGVTPLVHALSRRGVRAYGCDGNERLIDELRRFAPQHIYGSEVEYSAQDLTHLSFDDETFDAISCISVLEHIPAPADQQALRELLRVLKPGGLLVLTVDFSPTLIQAPTARWSYYIRRAADLTRRRDFRAIRQGLASKLHARRSIRQSSARVPRSANQCFHIEHLEQDILPLLSGATMLSRLSCSTDLRRVTPHEARRFWDLEDGLYDAQGRRAVLPAAHAFQKPQIATSL
jgi:ubiquinone/menaquinone biosynthesis C-methylase UbiE